MRKAAFVVGLAACVAVGAAPRACADDDLMQRIQDRLKHLPPAPPPPVPPASPAAGWLNELISRLAQCWDLPKEVQGARSLVISIRIALKSDGSLAAPPVVINRSSNPLFAAAAASAVRAVHKCAPFSFLPAANYNKQWNDIVVDFDAQMMFH